MERPAVQRSASNDQTARVVTVVGKTLVERTSCTVPAPFRIGCSPAGKVRRAGTGVPGRCCHSPPFPSHPARRAIIHQKAFAFCMQRRPWVWPPLQSGRLVQSEGWALHHALHQVHESLALA